MEIGRTSLRTAGKPAAVKLDAEKYDTLVFVNIDVVDEKGLLAADAAASLHIETEGPARLLGFAGPKALHRKGYEHTDTTAGEGHALAVLKRTGEDGKVTVKVSGEGLKEEIIEFA